MKKLTLIFSLIVILIIEGCQSIGNLSVKYNIESDPLFSNKDYNISSIELIEKGLLDKNNVHIMIDSSFKFFNKVSNFLIINVDIFSIAADAFDAYEIIIEIDTLNQDSFYALTDSNVDVKRISDMGATHQLSGLIGSLNFESTNKKTIEANLHIEFKQTCWKDDCKDNEGEIIGSFVYTKNQ